MTTREERLNELLAPITWSLSSSLRARQNHVVDRHRQVMNALPFMTEEEQRRAGVWFTEEQHNGLWD